MVNSIFRIAVLVNVFLLSYVVVSFAVSFFPYEVVDKELEPYYRNYEKMVKSVCKKNQYNDAPRKVIILVKELKENRIGLCIYGMYKRFEINILESWWENADESDRQQMIYHEAGHCLMGLGHSKDKDNYMYFEYNNIPLDLATEQAMDDIKERCSD